MAADVSTGRSTNELLAAATQGETAAVELLYTHYLQFGTDVAMEHGCEDPLAAYDQAFLETMAHSLELSRAEPGSFASHLERAIRGLDRPAGEPGAAAATEADPGSDHGHGLGQPAVADADDHTDEPTELDDTGPTGLDDTSPTELDDTTAATSPAREPLTAAEAVDEELAAEAVAAELGILPLAAKVAPPRTPNQLLDRFHARSLVTILAALALAALIGWVFVQSTAPSEPDPETGPTGQITPTAEPAG